MTIEARPTPVAVDASSIISLSGPPNRAVYWSLSGSSGTIQAVTNTTDDQGRASAIFTPAALEEGLVAVITASYGA